MRNCIASSVRLNLRGHSELVLCALAATESRSLLDLCPKASTSTLITFLVPALVPMWLCCELEQRSELAAE